MRDCERLSETPRGLTANHHKAQSGSSLFSLAQIVFNLEGGSVLTKSCTAVKPQLCGYGKLILNIPFRT